MSEGGIGEVANLEAPVQQSTVDKIAAATKKLIGIKIKEDFRSGEPDNGITLSITNFPVAPWRRPHQREGLRIGKKRQIFLTERRPVLDGTEMAVNNNVKRFELDTSQTQSPRLRIQTGVITDFLDRERGKANRSLVASFDKPEDDVWKPPTEQQARDLLSALEEFGKKNKLLYFGDPTTSGEKKNNKERRKDLEKSLDRIMKAAGDAVFKGRSGEELILSLDNQKVHITRNGASITVDISRLENVEGTEKTQRVSEIFFSYDTNPITYEATFSETVLEKRSTIRVPADENKLTELSVVLEQLTTEKVKKEIESRKTIRKVVKTLLANHGVIEEPDDPSRMSQKRKLVADFENQGFDLMLRSDNDAKNVFVVVENFVDDSLPDNEDNIKEQTFSLSENDQLEVRTFKFGEDYDKYQTAFMQPANDGQTDYLITMLDELGKPRPKTTEKLI